LTASAWKLKNGLMKRGEWKTLRTKPLEIKEQYERQMDLQEAYGEAMLSGWARGRKMPAMRQQLADLAGALHGQACHHIAQVGVGVMPVHAR
jgi:hypothetical protein